jgi:putative GTP pyrophosphokinase
VDPESTNEQQDIDSVLLEFEGRKDQLAQFCNKTRGLIEECLRDAGIRFQSVQSRVKDKNKLRNKFRDSSKRYTKLDDITDLAALRVITYYEDEVDTVKEIIQQQFDIDMARSVDKRNTEPDRFGYHAVNLICTHLQRRLEDVEYKKFSGTCCEIQITSVLQHTWSEIEHEWYDLKESYPDSIKRRFSRLAALIEIADTEFLEIRKLRMDYRRSVAVQVEAEVQELRVDAVSVRAFIDQEPLVRRLDEKIGALLGLELRDPIPEVGAEMRAAAANLAGLHTLHSLREAINRYEVGVLEYVDGCRRSVWAPTLSTHLEIGACIYHIAMMLISAKGGQAAKEAMQSLNINIGTNWNFDGQAAIAREVIEAY